MSPYINAILVLPRLRIQNLNTISSPLTWGAPSMTAVIGMMYALQRRFPAEWDIDLMSVGMISHEFQAQISPGFVNTFNLSRNPVGPDGKPGGIVEEGRAHMEVSLVFGVDLDVEKHPDDEHDQIAQQIQDIAYQMRFAGGSIMPALPGQEPVWQSPVLRKLGDDEEKHPGIFRSMRRAWLPGFALVSRDDLLADHLQEMKVKAPEASALDAWLDLSRHNRWAERKQEEDEVTGEVKEIVEWQSSRKQGSGWIVPIPIGYSALSETYQPGEVENARDQNVPFRFVESMYSIGQWISPHRLSDFSDILWYSSADESAGLYRCNNDYSTNN